MLPPSDQETRTDADLVNSELDGEISALREQGEHVLKAYHSECS